MPNTNQVSKSKPTLTRINQTAIKEVQHRTTQTKVATCKPQNNHNTPTSNQAAKHNIH